MRARTLAEIYRPPALPLAQALAPLLSQAALSLSSWHTVEMRSRARLQRLEHKMSRLRDRMGAQELRYRLTQTSNGGGLSRLAFLGADAQLEISVEGPGSAALKLDSSHIAPAEW